MIFVRTFLALLIKDFLVAWRTPLWTAFQLGTPIALGFATLPIDTNLPNRQRKSKPGLITPGRNEGSKRDKRKKKSSWEYVNKFTQESCSICEIYYTNTGPDRDAVQQMLARVPWKERREFASVTELMKFLNKDALHNGSACTVDAVGIEFKTLNKDAFTYTLYQRHGRSSSLLYGRTPKKPIHRVFASEYYSYDLSSAHVYEALKKAGYIQVCLVAASEDKVMEGKTYFEYQESGIRILEDDILKMTLGLLSGVFPLSLTPILICTATTIAVEKENGLKEFLLVTGVQRYTLFLEILVFSTLKVVFVVSVVIARFILVLPSYAVPVLILSTFLFSVGIATTAMFCAAVVKTSSSAMILSTLISLILEYMRYQASNVFAPDFFHYICLFNIFAAYHNLLAGVRICRLRGVANIGSALFAYDDIVNVGMSLLFLTVDVAIGILFVLFLDYLSIKNFAAFIFGTFTNMSEEKERSGADELSYHQCHQGTGNPVLLLNSVSKVWETTGEIVVNQFSMKAYRGQVTVLLGHNGAGKSTTFSMICGSTSLTRGSITIQGRRFTTGLHADRPYVGFCPQTSRIFDCLTVENHLWLFFILNGGEGFWHDEADILSTQLGLSHLIKKKAGKLSGGEKRKLSLALAFIGGRELVMLDEPTAGMDPQSRSVVKKIIEEKKKTRAIVLTTHYMDEVEGMGDFVYILQKGRCICSGMPYFLKSRFAPEIILSVVFTHAASEEDVEATSRIVCGHIKDAKRSLMDGSQVRFKLPRSEQRRIPELFADLENKKQLHINSFGLSTKALEEAFLQIGELNQNASKKTTEAFVQNQESADLHEDTAKILQQVRYISFKKFLNAIYSISLIVNQWILPLMLMVLIMITLQETTGGEEISSVPDMSLKRIKHGRFLVFDPSNNTNRRNLVEKVLHKYPHIEIVRFNSSDSELWPRNYPWPVGGVLIRSEKDVLQGKRPYTWLLANYLYRKEETLFHLISDVELASGQLRLRVSFTSKSVPIKPNTSDRMIAGVIFFLASVLLNASVVTSMVEERVSNFYHQQTLTGLSAAVYWITEFVLDLCVMVAVTGTMICMLALHTGSVKYMLMINACAYHISMIPFVYAVSLFIDQKGVAKCICIAYQACPALIMLEQTQDTYYKKFPSVEFLHTAINELGRLNKRWYTESKPMDFLCLLSHGLAFMILMYICESCKRKRLLTNPFKRSYVEKNAVEDGQDVIEERNMVYDDASEFTLKVQGLTKYYGSYCALKRITYGVRADDCFGLVGASGAGKTSTLDIITGLRPADDGSVFIEDQLVNRTQKIGYCPQFDSMLSRLSCKQNMLIIAGLIGYKSPKMIVDEIIRFFDLSEHCNKAFGRCSGGQRRQVSIGAALLNPSKLIILDEPTAGLDPEARRHVWSLLKTMRTSGKAVLLSSHSMEECEALCSRIGVLVRGRLVALGPSQALKSRYANYLFLHMILRTLKDREHVVDVVQSTFPSSSFITKNKDSLELKFKISLEHQEKISDMYRKAREIASKLPISDYFLLQSTLEDVLANLNELHSGKIL